MLATNPRYPGRIWESSCVCAGKGYEEDQRKQMRRIVPVESRRGDIADGESPTGQYDGDGSEGPEKSLICVRRSKKANS